MPTDTKNVALKRICSGMISPKAWWLKRLSLTTRPARKAPSDRLTPAMLVSQAVPRQMAMTVRRKSSGAQVSATRSSSGGISRRATTSTATMSPSAFDQRPDNLRARSALAAEHRHDQDHDDDREVLEDQQAERHLSVGRRGFAAVAEQLEHDRRRGQRHQKPGEERRPPLDAERRERTEHAEAGQRHLQPAAAEDQRLDAPQLLEAELDADREQQQDDADLCRVVDERRIFDQLQRVRTDDDAGDEEADDRHEADPAAQVGNHRRRHDDRDRLDEEGRREGGCDDHDRPARRRRPGR